MNLIIDVGNTLVKLAVFQDDVLFEKITVQHDGFINAVRKVLNKYPIITKGIISSVGKLNNQDVQIVASEIELLVLNSETKQPYKNLYKTPKTLGVDRIALVSASVEQFPDMNVLIIDAGTCITYDFINTQNEYFGGAISPGIRLRYHSLHNLTANLPLLESKLPKSLIGNTTESSIHSGVVFGVLKEIEGVINEYKEKYSDLTVILTGGDANFLSKQLKNGIFANSNFLLEGLNFILEYNTQ
ncbi:type III pantothenate kinase [Psychroserpens ponticola]|uniref:Type III pantothenate kinase n=1 Tax=Psychroserpens ponticola TaxID=2932268 RepID=A0ABY7RW21_9FLAO|nr:type III pantothenate kinase [Psychroserpens ponticola]WCO01188.1 type III pantothenate kinase [Psychroserpens ponticola]